MRFRDELSNRYFEWMYNTICEDRFPKDISYRKLIMCLHETEFTYCIRNDKNRAEDGIDLRRRFTLIEYEDDLSLYLDGPCSVLEMMLALAIRCEESIMDDPYMGKSMVPDFMKIPPSAPEEIPFDEDEDMPFD